MAKLTTSLIVIRPNELAPMAEMNCIYFYVPTSFERFSQVFCSCVCRFFCLFVIFYLKSDTRIIFSETWQEHYWIFGISLVGTTTKFSQTLLSLGELLWGMFWSIFGCWWLSVHSLLILSLEL